MSLQSEVLPEVFCWSKFGTEAGDLVSDIRARKERERVSAGGRFYWGVGGNVGPAVAALVVEQSTPEVLFTPMLSKPSALDVSPPHVVKWRAGFGLDGAWHELVDGVVTSRATTREPRRHYALVCEADSPIDVDRANLGFHRGSVVNLRSGAAVGSSQVTSVVRRVGGDGGRPAEYRVAFRARLVAPYVLTLVERVPGPPGVSVSGAPLQDALWA